MERGIDKVTKYQDLEGQLRRPCNVKTERVTVVIGALVSLLGSGIMFRSFGNKT